MRLPVWDAPLRLFHWALAALVTFSFVTGQVGGAWMAWHMRSGYALLALLLFRIGWGFFGGETARFASFLRGPAAIRGYLEAVAGGRYPQIAGHNPLGGWAVLALLAVVLLQAISGLFVDDEISNQGPLVAKVSGAWVARMTSLHGINRWLVLGAVIVHLAAIAAYRVFFRRDLVSPMVTGLAEVAEGTRAPRPGSILAAAAWLAACAAAIYGLVMVYPAGP